MSSEIAIFLGCLLPGLHTAYTDIKRGVIYDVVTLLIFLAGLIYAMINGTYIYAFLGCALGFLSFFIVAWITNGSLGGGDIKLAAGIGIWFGYQDTILIIVLAVFAGVVYELFCYWRQGMLVKLFRDRLYPYVRKILLRFGYRMKKIDLSVDTKYKPIPFAPFLIAGSWAVWGMRFFF
ncbi:Prepilin type IV endopeptidase, peptidase domain [Syntrophomonas zehnderi OL-4]|uniref:Prepilin type IV endopeptidase, peptidase domain n=1 Tax=Syntrophomonas zehnderi OL-4 TaxID=690567 RepID=A0A0E4GAL1_9FIRM|nr:A24 family peptidase [Syntrophomonas zehnderi]CFX15394.1 Prepilin type IV endopeptidase, peptidase domain [Syntrophomonas zehnderi OL-4]